ncbi:cyclin-D2-1-like [Wolffia australiana]
MQAFELAPGNLFCGEDADDVASWDGSEWELSSSPDSPLDLITSSSSAREAPRPIDQLFAAELLHMPRSDYLARFRDGSLDCAARQNAVNWILKVHSFYRFLPTTAALAVNYLDRFLSSQALPRGLGWPWQLLSVACLSIAAKIEETHVPLLVDLQILDPGYVFEPRTVRRMELLLMAALQWRMRSVTPFDFLGYFCGLVLSRCAGAEAWVALLRRASSLVRASHHVIGFVSFPSSAVAAAAVLCASGEHVEESSAFFNAVLKEAVEECRQLFAVCGGAAPPVKPPAPRSPSGVLDAANCGSCDTDKTVSDAALKLAELSPPSKRRKTIAASTSGVNPC